MTGICSDIRYHSMEYTMTGICSDIRYHSMEFEVVFEH